MQPALVDGTISNLQAFCHTFEGGSFTRAARALRVTPAAVSRSVARLEESLGAILFQRTTRVLRPTPAGAAYYAKCAEALRLLGEAQRSIAENASAEAGTVRLSVGTPYGLHVLLPKLGGFRAKHPGIELEIEVSNHNVDFVRDGFDLAVRMGAAPEDAGLVARKLDDCTLGVFAAPCYLAERGTPRVPDDLAAHETIAFLLPGTGRVLPWLFASPALEWTPAARLRCAVDPRAPLVLAAAGAGVAQGYHFLAAPEIERGRLVEILAPYRSRTRRFSLLYRREAGTRRAVRAVIEEIVRGR
jgi:DNA-binding transcriptional LysR family regulator